MRIFIGLPSTRFNWIEPLASLLDWIQGGIDGKPYKHDIYVHIQSGYGVDAARSMIIERAKKWGCDLLLMIDTDILPEQPLTEMLSLINQDLGRGYCAVVSPTLSIDGKVMVRAPEEFEKKMGRPWISPRELPANALFEIKDGAMGFVAISGDALRKLKELDSQDYVNGPSQPLYCLYKPKLGEDYSLCHNLRDSTGLKVGADSRLHVAHLKQRGIPSWRGAE